MLPPLPVPYILLGYLNCVFLPFHSPIYCLAITHLNIDAFQIIMGVTMLTLQTTNLPLDRFPDYTDPLESFESYQPAIEIMTVNGIAPVNKVLGGIKDEPSRHPSPQPTHFSVPLMSNGQNGHRVLRSATVGYIAPEFKGRAEQMNSGKLINPPYASHWLTRHSQGSHFEAGLDPRVTP